MNRFRTTFAFAFLAVPWSAHADDRCPEHRWPCAVVKPADAKVFVDGRSLKDRGTLRWYRWTPSKDEPSEYVTLTATRQDRVAEAPAKHAQQGEHSNRRRNSLVRQWHPV